ncbi:MAG: exodeoxyribonuclease V subunit alpha [Moraxellaceae bacterium]|nr:exodeoxyribonuclease V subunit alpha [Moraxellaceae bacterium]
MTDNHWSMAVAQYLLQRKKQTAGVYQTQQPTKDNLFQQHADTLLQTLFYQLGVALDNGHTVIYLEGESDWQKLLIEEILLDWQPLMENLYENLADTANFHKILFNSNQLDKAEQQYLLAQLKLANNLYQFFQQFNQSISDKSQALLIFYQQLCQFSLIKAISIQEDNSAPIIANFDHKKQTITLWLHRSWQAEKSIIANIQRLNQAKITSLDLNNINQDELRAEQFNAIKTANQSAFSIITGGPGTGKTYTVAQLVIAVYHANQLAIKQGKKPLSLILTAPTGKASQRMQESLQSALNRANVEFKLQEAKTIHRLLGIGQSGMPRYSADNPLAEDIIIVDEASMLGVELANYLLSSVKTGARLILLGDAHQLSAVEAGSVLGDLCNIENLQNIHAKLVESSRFSDNSAVGQLAIFINNPSINKSTKQLQQIFAKFPQDLTLQATYQQDKSVIYQKLIEDYQQFFVTTENLKSCKNISEELPNLMTAFNQFRILTAGHHGDYGDNQLNEVLSDYHQQFLQLPLSQSEWYHGRPVMVRKNNYGLSLFNGDIGICVGTADGLAVYFEGRENLLFVNMLANLEVSTAYAMTVHKSQGSEFTHVAVMLDNSDMRLLSRELFYTAVTRAKQQVSVYGSWKAMSQAINQPTVRRTGLELVG